MDTNKLIDSSRPFLDWLVNWYNSRPAADLAGLVREVGGAERIAIMSVDVTNGFCSEGALASERVGGIVQPIMQLFERAHGLGVRHFVLPQDTHSENAVEFGSFPPHCVHGTDEPMTVPQIATLSFSNLFQVIEKDSISSSIDTELDTWLAAHPEVTDFLVVGDCTDFCVYQLAMHLRLRANALGLRDVRVVLPVDCVDTFDLPVDVAERIGAMPHHGDLMHLIFLFNMAQNGIEIVKKVM